MSTSHSSSFPLRSTRHSNDEYEYVKNFKSKHIKYIYNDMFNHKNFPHKSYPLEKKPTWEWSTSAFAESDLNCFQTNREFQQLEILSREEEKKLWLHFNWHRYQLHIIQQRIVSEKRDLSEKEKSDVAYHFRVANHARSMCYKFNVGLIFGAVKKAQKISWRGIDVPEQHSEARVALLKSIDAFDASRGYKFSTYCYRSIFSAIRRAATKETTHCERNHVFSSFQRGDNDEHNSLASMFATSGVTKDEALTSDIKETVARMLYGSYEDQIKENVHYKLTELEKCTLRLRYGMHSFMSRQDIADQLPYMIDGVGYVSVNRVSRILHSAQAKIMLQIQSSYDITNQSNNHCIQRTADAINHEAELMADNHPDPSQSSTACGTV